MSVEGGRRPYRALVVDDNRDTADSLVVLLRLWGYEACAAYDGLQAVDVARDYRPDCVLSDIGLPGLDGYQLAERLRQEETLKDAVLIAISAHADEGRARAAGFDRLLLKPVEPPVVEGLLRRVLEMGERLERAEAMTKQQGEVLAEATNLMREVKQDVKEMKEGLREVRQDVKEIKQELRDLKEDGA